MHSCILPMCHVPLALALAFIVFKKIKRSVPFFSLLHKFSPLLPLDEIVSHLEESKITNNDD